MKANTFLLLFTDLCKASLIIAFRQRESESPVSSSNSSQTAEWAKVSRASGEQASSLSVSPACLRTRLQGACERRAIRCSTWASLLVLWPNSASPWEPPGGESSSGECLAREGGRGVEVQKLDTNPLWQCWTSDDPFLRLLTLRWAQQPAAVSGLMFVSRPAATQTAENTTWCSTLPTCLHRRRFPAAAEISDRCAIYCETNACASNEVAQAPTHRNSNGSPCLPAAHNIVMPALQQWPVSPVVSGTAMPSHCQSEGVQGLSWSRRPDSLT